MNQSNKGMWIGIVVVVILAALGWWWYSMSSGTQMSGQVATSTTTNTGTNTSSGVTMNDRSSSDVVSVAESISGSSEFASWLRSTGVAAQIKGKGPYTIFVPTDGSVSQLPPGTISNLSAAGLKRLVQYHVISGRAIDTTAQVAGGIQALSGDPLNFSYSATKIPMVDSAIVISEYKASNGVVYLIDNVLIPPQKATH
jgi:uncharacterized surface protein with fasciclin (FAS1) repeats